ncbi:MAG TPA: hypothetical protein VFX03_07355 [Thermomicrobiales bacterium]|nr:hypothetical protein [Thermomicrobiales bacterium]
MPDLTGITPDLLLPLAIIWIAPAVWIYLDVRFRGGRAIVWATEWLIVSAIALIVLRPLIWLPANAIGLVVYLFVRPKARESLPDWREFGGASAASATPAEASDAANGHRDEGVAGEIEADHGREEVGGGR